MSGQRWLAAVFIVAQALLVGITSWQVMLPAIACLLAVVAASWSRGLRLRGWLWSIVLVSVSLLVFLKCVSVPYSSELSSWVVPAAATLGISEYLLVVQACLLFHRRDDGGISGAIPVLGIVTITGIFNRTVIYDQHSLYLIMALLLTLMAAVLFRGSTETRVTFRTDTWGRRHWLVVIVLVMVAVAGWQISDKMTRNVGLLRPWAIDLGFSERRRTTGGDYVADATLHSVTASRNDRPAQVAIKVFCPRKPGYLRGKVFDTYYGAEWYNNLQFDGSSRTTRVIRMMQDRSMYGLPEPDENENPFTIDPRGSEPWTSMQVVNDPRRGKVFFTPLGTCHFYGEGQRIYADAHGIVHGGVATSAPYTALLPNERVRSQLSPTSRNHLINMPAGLDRSISALATRIESGNETTREKVDSVEAFFQKNFEYAIGELRVPKGQEPLTYFLINRPPAHCEFFASGAVVLLRGMGVPCRYVTGYVVEEQDEYQDYWIARNRNAHAWAEAYDEELQRWIIVEATPGMTAPEEEDTEDNELAGTDTRDIADAAFALAPRMFDGDWSAASLAAVGLFFIVAGTFGGYLTVPPRIPRPSTWPHLRHRSVADRHASPPSKDGPPDGVGDA